jgi:large subunit ribosomal protein L21
MYAVIDDRGSHIKVAEGEVLNVDLLDGLPGAEVVFDRVLLYSDESGVVIGKPTVEGAEVVAEVVGLAKGKKVHGVSFRRRKNSKVRKGHRQKYSRVRIKQIKAAGSPGGRNGT